MEYLPKVSIIIPCYNDKKNIAETINSALDQTYKNIEIIIVDDGSTDGSAEFVSNYFPGIKLKTKTNGGPASARNYGAQFAEGDFLQFQDSDDLIERDKIRLQIAMSMKFPDQVIYGPIKVFRSVNGINVFDPPMEVLEEKEDVLYRWLRGWFTIPTALLWPRSIYDRVGGFDETLFVEEDTDIALRAVLMGYRLILCPDAFSYYRTAESNTPQARNSQSQMNPKTFKSRVDSLEKLEKIITEKGQMARYRDAIAERYYTLARMHIRYQPQLSNYCFKRFTTMSSTGRPPGSLLNWFGVKVLGLPLKEKLADAFGNLRIKQGKDL